MAARRVVLILFLVAAVAACSGLLASSSSSSPAVVRAACDLPHSDDGAAPAAATTGFQPPTVDADCGALRGVLPHLIHPSVLTDDPAVQRTVHDDVTVVFRATARLRPSRLQYYVVPADACGVPFSGSADDSTKARDGSGTITFFLGLIIGAFLGVMTACILGVDGDDESSRNGATPKDPEVVFAQAAGGAKARGG